MVTTELSPPRRVIRRLMLMALGSTAGLFAVTAIGGIAGGLDHSLAFAQRPHPVLHPDVEACMSIVVNNARVLCLPVLLALLGLGRHRLARMAGDALIVAQIVLNGLFVGIEIGRWQGELTPYLPQLPVEWLAAGAAAGVWFTGSRHDLPRSVVIGSAAIVFALLCAAAAIEVLLTPHAPRPRT